MSWVSRNLRTTKWQQYTLKKIKTQWKAETQYRQALSGEIKGRVVGQHSKSRWAGAMVTEAGKSEAWGEQMERVT